MSRQFISVAGLTDTLYNASRIVESWDIEQYDRVNTIAPRGPKAKFAKGSSVPADGLPGLPGNEERKAFLAEFYAKWANNELSDEEKQSPFRQMIEPDEIPPSAMMDTTPAKLGFFRADAQSSSDWGYDLGDNV